MSSIPTLRYLMRREPELRRMAQILRTRLRAALPSDRFSITLAPEQSQVGGGSLPGENLPTVCVALRATGASPTPDEIAARLRAYTPPIFARIKDDAVLFDPRTLEPDEIITIAEAASALVSSDEIDEAAYAADTSREEM
jgi:L-seryl-tRNA(Ser) seleniumtransferase